MTTSWWFKAAKVQLLTVSEVKFGNQDTAGFPLWALREGGGLACRGEQGHGPSACDTITLALPLCAPPCLWIWGPPG